MISVLKNILVRYNFPLCIGDTRVMLGTCLKFEILMLIISLSTMFYDILNKINNQTCKKVMLALSNAHIRVACASQ
jgi:hypothetical protein